MEDSFSVTVCGKHAGKVQVQRQGLYYHFFCSCKLSGDIIYRLMVSCGSKRENLGILVPQEGSFVLNTKVPVKRIGTGDLSFTLQPRQETSAGAFVPISPEEPFAYISRLKRSFLILKEGQAGIQMES